MTALVLPTPLPPPHDPWRSLRRAWLLYAHHDGRAGELVRTGHIGRASHELDRRDECAIEMLTALVALAGGGQ